MVEFYEGFEDDDSLNNWNKRGESGGFNITDDKSYEGKYSGNVYTDNIDTAYYIYTKEKFDIKDNKTELSCYLYADDPKSGTVRKFGFYDHNSDKTDLIGVSIDNRDVEDNDENEVEIFLENTYNDDEKSVVVEKNSIEEWLKINLIIDDNNNEMIVEIIDSDDSNLVDFSMSTSIHNDIDSRIKLYTATRMGEKHNSYFDEIISDNMIDTIFNKYKNGTYTVDVEDYDELEVEKYGAGGGGGEEGGGGEGDITGGNGGYLKYILNVKNESQLEVIIGEGGKKNGGEGHWNGGEAGDEIAGGGGGSTSIAINDHTDENNIISVSDAGGGGGGQEIFEGESYEGGGGARGGEGYENGEGDGDGGDAGEGVEDGEPGGQEILNDNYVNEVIEENTGGGNAGGGSQSDGSDGQVFIKTVETTVVEEVFEDSVSFDDYSDYFQYLVEEENININDVLNNLIYSIYSDDVNVNDDYYVNTVVKEVLSDSVSFNDFEDLFEYLVEE
ncbi:MAG: glycine-rich protein, partial [Candidatus Woesearchaeota archaeon]